MSKPHFNKPFTASASKEGIIFDKDGKRFAWVYNWYKENGEEISINSEDLKEILAFVVNALNKNSDAV